MNRTMTTAEAARFLGLSQQTIRKYVRQGVLPARRMQPSRRLLIPSEAVQRLLERSR